MEEHEVAAVSRDRETGDQADRFPKAHLADGAKDEGFDEGAAPDGSAVDDPQLD